ncbi:MAG: hypothetical protein JO120_03005 [Solirubrobacterales bacterium]|nr:hypothetical protein [Solirubrobacterales bacterium]
MRARHDPLAAFAIAGALACFGCGSAMHPDVIRAWARALTAGELEKAASYFTLPAIVENGTPPVRVTSRAQVLEFNQLLPCGARLVATVRRGVYTYATFRLTQRVGGDCGAGTGALAATAFLIRDGKIAEWRRLPNPGSGRQPPSAPTPAPAPSQGPVV